jgi:hypothetical protein
MTVLDPALQRRAAIIEEFLRPTPEERRELFTMDLGALPLTEAQLSQLVALTGAQDGQPAWTYSDIRTRLYPAALAMAFPERPLKFDHLQAVASTLKATPIVKNY